MESTAHKKKADEKDDKAADKAQLREHFQQLAKSYVSDKPINDRIVQNLVQVLPTPAVVAAYKAKDHEPDLTPLFRLSGRNYVFPRVKGETLEFLKPHKPQDFKLSSWSIMEPDPAQSTSFALDEIQVILVPGVAFDRDLARLGRGRGFYDRVLNQFKGLKIGIATAAQISNAPLPREDHDCVMDIVVTDQFVLSHLDS